MNTKRDSNKTRFGCEECDFTGYIDCFICGGKGCYSENEEGNIAEYTCDECLGECEVECWGCEND